MDERTLLEKLRVWQHARADRIDKRDSALTLLNGDGNATRTLTEYGDACALELLSEFELLQALKQFDQWTHPLTPKTCLKGHPFAECDCYGRPAT